MYIFTVDIPVAPELKVKENTTLLLAAIRSCKLGSNKHPSGFPYYVQFGELEVVDMTCVQCLIGRIPLSVEEAKKGAKAKMCVIDRTGGIQESIFIPDH
jgi:hypothetical protein